MRKKIAPTVVLMLFALSPSLSSCGGSATNPTTTPQASPTVTSLAVSGAGFLAVGQSSQFAATALLSNGTQQSYTSLATWQSTNPSVVVVSSGGMVTASGQGTADIRATYQGVTGSSQVLVAVSVFALSGIVRDKGTLAALPAARIEIESGANLGRSTVSGSDGRYRLSGLAPGTFDVKAYTGGYDNERRTNFTLTSDSVIDFLLTKTGSQPPPPQSSCTYALTSAKNVSFGTQGGSGTVSFTPASGSCTWVASSTDPSWLSVQDVSGTGSISIRFTVGVNHTGLDREGQVQVRWPGPQVGENIVIKQSR